LTDRNVHQFQEVNPAEFVGYRNVSSRSYEDGVKSFSGEFDPRTLLFGVEPLKQMVRSNDQRSRRVSSAMLKTAAILLTLGGDKPFQYMAPPRLSAMNLPR